MTLNDLVEEAHHLHKQIVDGSPEINSLLRRSAEVESEIKRRMRKGEHIEDQLLEFALRGYARTSDHGPVYSKSAFVVVPKVVRFMEAIAQFKGQRILSACGTDIEESGIISGECVIRPWSEYIHMLNIPVDEHYRGNVHDEVVKRVPVGYLFVHGDFFREPFEEMQDSSRTEVDLNRDGGTFRHIFAGVFYGGIPKNRAIFIGDKYVEAAQDELA